MAAVVEARPATDKEKKMIHLEVWEKHQLHPLCGDMTESSRTYSKTIFHVDCRACLDKYNLDCSWCDGTGKFGDGYGDLYRCGQCDGTGYCGSST